MWSTLLYRRTQTLLPVVCRRLENWWELSRTKRFEFREKSSLLLKEVIGMSSQFVIEAMHAIDLAVTKRLIKAIVEDDVISSKISKTAISTLQSRFKLFRRIVPSNFAKTHYHLKKYPVTKQLNFVRFCYTQFLSCLKALLTQSYSNIFWNSTSRLDFLVILINLEKT